MGLLTFNLVLDESIKRTKTIPFYSVIKVT